MSGAEVRRHQAGSRSSDVQTAVPVDDHVVEVARGFDLEFGDGFELAVRLPQHAAVGHGGDEDVAGGIPAED